jgi:hypothetical protein
MAIGSISIHTDNASVEMQTTKPELNMSQNHVKVQIKSELPRVIIDQTECFNTSGLKNNTALSLEISSEGYQHYLEYVQTTAEDGAALAAIERGGNPIKEIAVKNAYTEHTFGIVSMPSAGPRIDVTGDLKINFSPDILGTSNGVNFNVRLGTLDTRYIPGRVSIDFRV